MLIAVVCLAQQTIPEPEVGDIFYRLGNDSLVPLERQSAAFQGGAHGFMIVGTKVASEFPGSKSPVRFSRGSLAFIVRSSIVLSSVDPNTIYCLRKLSLKKKTRELLMMSGRFSPIGGSATTTPAEGILPIEFSKYGDSSLKVTTGELTPGEYAIGRPYGPAVFCFGVD